MAEERGGWECACSAGPAEGLEHRAHSRPSEELTFKHNHCVSETTIL